uniref:Uncharacterized protein n=1 Tax=Rhodosorus marinus TaxID=101924 RepID=A0A6T6NM29_9RHOD|mmetsp:Transcript_6770/g.9871  ORF Transcript_6770/g.9871 Transcript_6770/m.9871 type:complete len:158 (+) Transcript_6770:806-1279(+)
MRNWRTLLKLSFCKARLSHVDEPNLTRAGKSQDRKRPSPPCKNFVLSSAQLLLSQKRGVWKNAEQKPFTELGFKSISNKLFVSKPESKLHEGYCEDAEMEAESGPELCPASKGEAPEAVSENHEDPEMETESGPEMYPVSKLGVSEAVSEDGFVEFI